MHHGTEPVLGAAIADASTELVLGGWDMLPLMSRVVAPSSWFGMLLWGKPWAGKSHLWVAADVIPVCTQG